MITLPNLPNMAPRGLPPINETLPAAIENLIRTVNPQKIILFGSYAYGNPTPDSDVDLLVIWDTSASHTERYMQVARSLRPRLFPVDIVVKTPQEIEESLNHHSFFTKEIYKKGIVLYERT